MHSAIQRRGYDVNLVWKTSSSIDEMENQELVIKYTQDNGVELNRADEYKYPCYYEALRLGLWEESTPELLKKSIPFENVNKVNQNSESIHCKYFSIIFHKNKNHNILVLRLLLELTK